jgi:hypothetical protein
MLLTSKGRRRIQECEKKMEAIIDAIPDLMIEVGLDGTIYNYHSHQRSFYGIHGSIYR